ncbi:MAG: HD domain-containing protein [bacterium]|nr:HD domain-containing protein [bacterium]
MKKLIYFNQVYSVKDFDRKPLPANIHNSEGAILAKKGQKLSKERLTNTYVYVDDEFVPANPETKKDSAEPEESVLSGSNETISPEIPPEMKDDYEEEKAEEIDERINDLDFEVHPDAKMGFRKNVYKVNELFQKTIINGVSSLASKDNEKISRSIAEYLEVILTKNLLAYDYMDMINAVRNKDNYLTFSHASAVAFYTLAISKKLKFLKDDLATKNLGKWLPVKTPKHTEDRQALLVSNQVLRYTDYQKDVIKLKYHEGVTMTLSNKVSDLIYQYAAIDPNRKYSSFSIDFSDENRLLITMAALNSDIGKICIHNNILNKKKSLTMEEFNIIEKHPSLGVAKLKEIGVNNSRMFAYILGHHRLTLERGYPPAKKLPPPESKIIAIADLYDGLRSPKYYGVRFSQDEAFDHIKLLYKEGAFDLPLVITALHTFEEYNHMYLDRRKKKLSDQKIELEIDPTINAKINS